MEMIRGTSNFKSIETFWKRKVYNRVKNFFIYPNLQSFLTWMRGGVFYKFFFSGWWPIPYKVWRLWHHTIPLDQLRGMAPKVLSPTLYNDNIFHYIKYKRMVIGHNITLTWWVQWVFLSAPVEIKGNSTINHRKYH